MFCNLTQEQDPRNGRLLKNIGIWALNSIKKMFLPQFEKAII